MPTDAVRERTRSAPPLLRSRAGASASALCLPGPLPLLGLLLLLALAAASLFAGVSAFAPGQLAAGDPDAWNVLLTSRIPRTLAAVLSGAALAVAGLIMQLIARNRFVEPSTVGTSESAVLGVLLVVMLAPGAPVLVRIGTASLMALAGTALFLALIRRIPAKQGLLVPLVGIMLGGVIAAATTFLAYEANLLQGLNSFLFGDFSRILKGRYELLWIVAAAAGLGYLAADRFTLIALGGGFSTSLGLNHAAVVRLGLVIVAVISAVTVTTVGALPFLGLVVPNLVSLLIGDNMRRAVPWTALLGACLVLAADLLARLIRFPFEVPVGLVLSVIGALAFLAMLARSGRKMR